MDKSWMRKSRLSQEYEDGIEQFLNFAFANSSEDDRIICPCIKCMNAHWQTRGTVLEHLVCDGILQGYTCWSFHGECVPSPTRKTTNTFIAQSSSNPRIQTSRIRPDSMEELLRDAFNIPQVDNKGLPPTTNEFNAEVNDGGEAPREFDEQPSKEVTKFYKLLEDMNDKLYEGSQHSRLYFCIRLFHLKCMCGMTAKGLDHLIEFLKEFFPSAVIPESSRELKVIKDLGLGYEKIHNCPNDCMLYWERNGGQQSCQMCDCSRWVSTDSDQRLNEDNEVVPSSSADSNHNEQESNQNNSTKLENVPAANEAENLYTVDSNGQQKKRCRTTLKDLWSLPLEERIVVSANHLGQPIGPEAQLLSGFLGMLARTGQQIGLHYESWHKVPKTLKDELFKFIELRFALGISKEYVLKSLGKKWRDYKHDLKKRHFKREDGLQTNKDKHPNATIQWQWEQLVDFWYSKKGEDSERLGVTSRKQQKYTHISGSKSFARKEKEMEVNSGRKDGRLEFFKATLTKKDGPHMTVETEQILDKANEKLAEYEIVDEDMQMVGKEQCGRVRGLGLGPTLKSYYEGTSSRTSTASSSQSSEFVQRFHQLEQQMQQLKEERKQERAQHEQECARYNALLGFLQAQFPGVIIPGVDIVNSLS